MSSRSYSKPLESDEDERQLDASVQDEKKSGMSSTDSPQNIESVSQPGGDEEVGEVNAIPSEDKKSKFKKSKSLKHTFFSRLFGSDYNSKEVQYLIFAACLLALNCGLLNGVTMSEFLYQVDIKQTVGNPQTQMIAGFAGAFTDTAHAAVELEWKKYFYFLGLIASYMLGAFIAAMICPRAKPYVIEPRYGPTFLIGAIFLLVASFLDSHGKPSRYVFYLATASNGVQNGIASIYSANLIRCTLTGAITDIAIVIAQCIHGNYNGLARGIVLGAIVSFFWIGGLLSFFLAKILTTKALYINAVLFLMIGMTLVCYLVKELGVPVNDAILGTWQWKEILQKLDKEEGDDLTTDKLIKIFDKIDAEGNKDGTIDAEELESGLKRARVSMTNYNMKTLFRAADDDGDGLIDRDEWENLCKKIL